MSIISRVANLRKIPNFAAGLALFNVVVVGLVIDHIVPVSWKIITYFNTQQHAYPFYVIARNCRLPKAGNN